MCEDHQDPFHVHIELLQPPPVEPGAGALGAANGDKPITLKDRFEGGEHQWLGMLGATAACAGNEEKLEMLRGLRRPNDKSVLTYGEIVALSGDFYGTPEELLLEKPATFPWLPKTNDLARLQAAFKKELTWIRDENRPRSAGYPDNTLTFVWTAKSYIELAEDNTAHFGWHNLVKYCEHHGQAIRYALKAKSQTASDENWMRAIFYNGFADHFLTDGFAAGHIRVPREEIRTWALTKGYSGKLAGLLSKVLHDQDGHVSTFHAQGEGPISTSEGLPVQNSRNIKWSTRCDGQLFLVPSKEDAPLIAEPVAAVAASLSELFEAQQEQRVPDGEYRALQYVPFPDPSAPALSQKFADTSPARLEKLLKSFKWYTEVPFIEASLNDDNIRSLFEALPVLMKSFAHNVGVAYSASADLRKRLPKPYVTAFKNIS